VAAVTEIRQSEEDSWRIVAKDLSMKTRRLWMLGLLAPLALAACAASGHPKAAAAAGKVTPQLRSGSNELRTYLLEGWIAPDDHTLILNATDRSLFEGRFKSQCTGLRLVNTIAFIIQAPPQVDKYEGIVLPDGKRCTFTSLTRVETAPAAGKDSPATENP
jgi:hypothetical protein